MDKKDPPYQCNDCGRRFFTKKQLSRHIRDYHGPTLSCSLCSYSVAASRAYLYKKHLENAHGYPLKPTKYTVPVSETTLSTNAHQEDSRKVKVFTPVQSPDFSIELLLEPISPQPLSDSVLNTPKKPVPILSTEPNFDAIDFTSCLDVQVNHYSPISMDSSDVLDYVSSASTVSNVSSIVTATVSKCNDSTTCVPVCLPSVQPTVLPCSSLSNIPSIGRFNMPVSSFVGTPFIPPAHSGHLLTPAYGNFNNHFGFSYNASEEQPLDLSLALTPEPIILSSAIPTESSNEVIDACSSVDPARVFLGAPSRYIPGQVSEVISRTRLNSEQRHDLYNCHFIPNGFESVTKVESCSLPDGTTYTLMTCTNISPRDFVPLIVQK